MANKKETILIVDDSEMNRLILSEMLGNEYNIIEAVDGVDGIKQIEKNLSIISIVLLDLIMPKADGFDVMSYMKQYNLFDRMPVIMITSESDPKLIKKAYDLGAADYISRPFDLEIVKRRVSNTIFLYAKQRKLSAIIANQIRDKEKVKNLMVGILSHIVEFRNGESGLHVLHISKLTEVLLRKIANKHPEYKELAADMTLISNAAALHDIGKIVIPEKILNKPGRLTPEEFEVIKTHSEIGANIIKTMAVNQDEPMLKYAYQICRWHHERFDGSGYPDGLVGNEIPMAAQIVSLVDVYDALTSKRCYKPAFSHEKALDIILNEEKGKYNPIIIEAFLDSQLEVQRIVNIKDYQNSIDESEIGDDQFIDIENEMLKYDDLSIYNKEIQIMRIEREKTIYASQVHSNTVFMSYRISQSLLGITGSNLDQLGLTKLIVNPEENESIKKLLGPDFFKRLLTRAKQANFKDTDYFLKTNVTIGDKTMEQDIMVRTIWSLNDNSKLINILFSINRF